MLFGNIVYSDKLPVCLYMYIKNDGSKGVVVMLRLRYTIFFLFRYRKSSQHGQRKYNNAFLGGSFLY